jgi:hypothetical protein
MKSRFCADFAESSNINDLIGREGAPALPNPMKSRVCVGLAESSKIKGLAGGGSCRIEQYQWLIA